MGIPAVQTVGVDTNFSFIEASSYECMLMHACSPTQCYAFFVCAPVSGKMIRPMVTFVVIYCVCVWSTVCFSSIEAGPLPHQHQSNVNETTGKLVMYLIHQKKIEHSYKLLTGKQTMYYDWDLSFNNDLVF